MNFQNRGNDGITAVNDGPDTGGLALDDLDALTGGLPADAGTTVAIYENGRRWAGVPTAGTPEKPAFSCQLRPVAEPRTSTVEVRDASGARLFARATIHRPVRRNDLGLRASDVFELAHPPLASVPWMSFDGVKITIGGGHLPPGGDPSSLSVKTGPGVVATFDYPLVAPGWPGYFWYWPNAGLSYFLLTIDLVASDFGADPFHLEFVETRDNRTRKLSDLWLPNDLRSFLGFTKDVTLIDRVQWGFDAYGIVLPGYSTFRYLEAEFRRYGIDPEANPSVLDWGCGVGRLTAHFIRQWPHARIFGTDVDAANVAWCESSLGAGFTICPLWPPTAYDDASFDGAFGVSVMTHLTAEAQTAWLRELARVLRPGGIALLTFGGVSGTANGSRWRSAEWWDQWRRTGFDAESRDPILTGSIADDDYYRQSNQTIENVRETWSEHFEIVEIVEAAFGNQDMAVMRRR